MLRRPWTCTLLASTSPSISTGISGGIVLSVGQLVSGSGSNRLPILHTAQRLIELVYSSLLDVQDTLTIVATSMNGTSNVSTYMNWWEVAL